MVRKRAMALYSATALPIIVAVASVGHDTLGREATQEAEHVDVMPQAITKWY